MNEMLQRGLHGEDLLRLRFQGVDVGLGQCFDDTTGVPTVLPQPDEFGDLGNRETEVARLANEPQGVDVAVAILPVAAQLPGVSMAAVAMAHGINANLLRCWVHEVPQPPVDAVAVSDRPVGFIALPMPAPPAPSTPSAEPIRIEVRRGSTIVDVTWLASAADACAAWMRELLR